MIEKFEDKYIIKYLDIDKTGYATPISIIDYMQEASSMHGEVTGCTIQYMFEKEFVWILIEKCVNIFELPKLDEEITIRTWSCGNKGLYAYRKYEVYNSDNKLIANANSKWIMYSTSRKRPVKIDDETMKLYYTVGDISDEGFVHFEDDKHYDKITKQTVYYKDIDTNWHMNNKKYIKLAIESMDSEFLDKHILEKYSVKYIKQLMYTEKYNICMKKISDSEYMYYINQDNEPKNNCEIYIKWKQR